MSVEVHIDWAGGTQLVGRLYSAAHSPAVSFEYAPEWLVRADAFAIDPTSLPLRSFGDASCFRFWRAITTTISATTVS